MIVEKKAVDPLAADVDPKKRVAPVVVDDALADDVGGVEDYFSSHGSVPCQPSGGVARPRATPLLTAQWASSFAPAPSYFMGALDKALRRASNDLDANGRARRAA